MMKNHCSTLSCITISLFLTLFLAGCGDDDDNDTGGTGGNADAAAQDGSYGEAGDENEGGRGGKGGSGKAGSGGLKAGGGTTEAGGAGGSTVGTESAGSGGSISGGAGGVGGAGGAGGTTTTTTSPCPAGHACKLAGDAKGFCRNDACSACTGASEDNACSVAYGEGQGYMCVAGECVAGECRVHANCPAGKLCGASASYKCGNCSNDTNCTDGYGAGFICVSGTCIQGNCEANSECPQADQTAHPGGGQICGLTTPYNCGACTSDSQCQTSYGATFICDTKDGDADKGKCIPGACTANNAACPLNAGDFCCALACIPGNCCETTDCAGLGNTYACVNHTCTTCLAATDNTYYVDPVGGSDTVGTGHNSGGCRFKTIKKALTVLGASPAAGTKILLLKGPIGTDTGETFPIAVPQNVTIAGSGGRVQIVVPANTRGFTMAKPSSGLENLSINGSTQTATNGIYVQDGSAETTTIQQVEVNAFAQDGIRITGAGVLSIGAGVSSTNNGATNGTAAAGLRVGEIAGTTAAKAVIVAAADKTPLHFDDNTGYGIRVNGGGSISINATASTAGNGTLTANRNGAGGVQIWQSPGDTVPANNITGLVAWANEADGLTIYAGSSVVLRNSYILNNAGNGVTVTASIGTGGIVYDLSKIDLGKSGLSPSYGHNTLQAASGNNPNTNAGVCLSFRSNTTAVTLNAAGNVFSGKDCSTIAPGALTSNADCTGGVDVSARATTNIGGGTAVVNKIDTLHCTNTL